MMPSPTVTSSAMIAALIAEDQSQTKPSIRMTPLTIPQAARLPASTPKSAVAAPSSPYS